MDQSDLGEFEDGDRPARAEARAVAGAGEEPTGGEEQAVGARFESVERTIEMAVMQVDYTVEGRASEERPIVHVFGRTPEGELVHARVLEFRPYFYAPAETATEQRLSGYDRITGWEHTDEDGEEYESIRGENLVKIFGQTPRDVGQIRDEFDHFEADILFPDRFLIDKDVTSGVRVPAREINTDSDRTTLRVHHDEVEPADVDATPRVNTFDIEVDDRSGFPEDGEEPIVCLTSHDSVRDEYLLWLYEAPDGEGEIPEQLDGYEPIEGRLDTEIRSFDTEAAMLDAFVDYIEATDPDIACGWNFTDFDAPYLLDRLERIDPETDRNLSIERLSRVDEVWRDDWQGPNVKGRVMFDLLYAYQRTQFTELESYRLEEIGQRELGVGKERYAGDIGDLWEDDPEQLLAYNLRDVELCVELDREQEIIAFWNEVRQFVGCKLEDATTPGDAVDMYVLHKLHDNFALPSKGSQAGEEYEGGAVFDPITGVRENVSVLDLKSLYPMCMVTVNASPETKVDPGDYDGDTYRAPNGTRFRKEPDGVIREMVDELLTEREEKKSRRDDHDPNTDEYEQYDRQQSAVKVIMNCFTPDTEVLTPDGVRNIRELAVGEKVYSLNPDTMEMEVKPVVETHAYPEYDGELVDIRTDDIDLSVTPNHRMLVRSDDTDRASESGWEFVDAGELHDDRRYELPHDWTFDHGAALETVDCTELVEAEYEVRVCPSVDGDTFTAELGWEPPTTLRGDPGEVGYVFTAEQFERHRAYVESVCERSSVRTAPDRPWVPRTYDGEQFLELLARFVTAGSVHTSGSRQFEGEPATTVELMGEVAAPDGGESEHTHLEGLLDRRGFESDHDGGGRAPDHDGGSRAFVSGLLGEFLRGVCGESRSERQIPDIVFEANKRQKALFLDALLAGNGDRGSNSWQVETTSERLRDDLLKLCTHLGLTANYSHDDGSWRVHCTETATNSFRMNRSGTRSQAENGVYCVTVADNHTLIAGRNGTFQSVGQSLYGVLGWDRFRLYDREMGAAVTATGREVIEFTERVTSNLNKNVIYGDTDSVMVSVGDDVDKKESIERSFEIEERINEAYDEFALEELNAAEHRFEIEFEKLYRRFFQAGKKKRYAGHIVWKEGKDVDDIDITGFEYQRSDIAPITKEVQREVIERVVTGADRDELKQYVTEVVEEFQTGEADLERVGIPGGIGKRLDNYDTDTAQVRGAKYANRVLGTNFQRGSKPKRLYIDRVHANFFERIEDEQPEIREDEVYQSFKCDPDVICFEYADQVPEEFEIDWEKMLAKTLEGPIERILEAIDISWAEVESGQEQTGLGEFM